MQALASPRTHSKARHPEEAVLVRYDSGEILAVSLSRPGITYRVELAPPSCECPSFAYRADCYHFRAAAQRFGQVEAAAAPSVCGNCGERVDKATDIPPYVEIRGVAPYWRCRDLNRCLKNRGW